MPQTVTLTKRRSGFANVPATFRIGNYDDGSSCLVSCKDYILPEGFHVAKCNGGTLEIYDADNNHHQIIEHSSGRPQLVSWRQAMPVLADAPEPTDEANP